MDACGGRAADEQRDTGAFDAWVKAHEAHNNWFNEWKKQSARATKSWRELSLTLDGSGVRPGTIHAAVVQRCAALGIDRWVIPAKLAQQSWRDLLETSHRPGPQMWDAWRAFLRTHGFGADVEAAFRDVERDAALADVASVELEHAYRRLLEESGRQSGATVQARDNFRLLIAGGEKGEAE
jgi:hypothetical protein